MIIMPPVCGVVLNGVRTLSMPIGEYGRYGYGKYGAYGRYGKYGKYGRYGHYGQIKNEGKEKA